MYIEIGAQLMPKKIVSITLSEEMYQALKALAAQTNRTMGGVIEDLISGALRLENKPLDLNILRDRLSRFADYYVEYLIIRKIREREFCSTYMPDDILTCSVIEHIIKRILAKVGLALSSRLLNAKELAGLAEVEVSTTPETRSETQSESKPEGESGG